MNARPLTSPTLSDATSRRTVLSSAAIGAVAGLGTRIGTTGAQEASPDPITDAVSVPGTVRPDGEAGAGPGACGPLPGPDQRGDRRRFHLLLRREIHLLDGPPDHRRPGAGHATISTAAATVLGYFFPDQEAALAARAEEARNSRLWAGIHFPIDNDMGAVMGGLVGRLVILRDRDDSGG